MLCSIEILVENQSCKYLLFAAKERLFDNLGQFGCSLFLGLGRYILGVKGTFGGLEKVI